MLCRRVSRQLREGGPGSRAERRQGHRSGRCYIVEVRGHRSGRCCVVEVRGGGALSWMVVRQVAGRSGTGDILWSESPRM